MKCSGCGEDKNFWTELTTTKPLINRVVFSNFFGRPMPTRKLDLCATCLDKHEAAALALQGNKSCGVDCTTCDLAGACIVEAEYGNMTLTQLSMVYCRKAVAEHNSRSGVVPR